MGNMYVGINNIARKVSNIYIGINNIAKKVSKGYIGVNNIARLFYTSEITWIHGTTSSPLTESKSFLSGCTVGDYALFCGGNLNGGTANSATADSYNSSLTKGLSPMTFRGAQRAATSGEQYAFVAGGLSKYNNQNTPTNACYWYSASLSVTMPPSGAYLGTARYSLNATTVGDYALFAGGMNLSNMVATMDCYIISTATKYGLGTSLTSARAGLAATTVGDYALFAGGYNSKTSNQYFNTVDYYTSSLTHGTATNLSSNRNSLAATTVGDYALFAGGYYGSGSYGYGSVDTYNSSLTRGSATKLTNNLYGASATTIGNYALVAGGYNGNRISTVDTYDISLTKGVTDNLSEGKNGMAATTVGNYALFAGGIITPQTTTLSNVVEYYTLL